MAGKKLLASGVVLAVVAGYGTLDAFDKVPGVLTTADANEVREVKVSGKRLGELVPGPVALPPAAQGRVPSADEVKKVLDESLKNPWWSETTAMTVRDASTGTVLAEHDSSKETTPASITKMASAFAVAHSKLDLGQTLKTRALLQNGVKPTLTLVAGGDMVLAKDGGDPAKVAGRAGLGDLASQAATELKRRGVTKVTVNTNTSYAPGPDRAPGWNDQMLQWGFAARISTLALADDRSDDHTPAVANPTKNAGEAFVEQLKKRGIDASFGSNQTNPPGGEQVGQVESAPVADLMGLALQASDNSMTESITRQAAALDGVKGEPKSVAEWVVAQAKKQGIDTAGMHLVDTSGLSDGTRLPVRVIGEMIGRATSGKDPKYGMLVSQLPVAAWSGTLNKRFHRDDSVAADGLVRAKTGSLVGVSSLAGVAVTKSNRKLVFVVTTNGQQPQGPDGAKAAIDAFATKLTQLP